MVYESPAQHYSASLLNFYYVGAIQKYDYKLVNFPILTPADQQRYEQCLRNDIVGTNLGYLYDGHLGSSIKIYEIVSGARIVGFAQANSTVQLRLNLSINTTGRKFVYVRSGTTDHNGRYNITVPYSTVPNDASTVIPEKFYELFTKTSNDKNYIRCAEFSVSAEQVDQGQVVDLGHIKP
jgi:asparagine N-glycosylation enzyme membrane subunit Stt3